ncbi:MAG: competence/damage-inducible protein A [Chloroflexi bacterium]|nr:competence/damage-inducible protein A [Chloroflexota bacterium]
MRAEIASIGTELLLGQITDTNAAFIAAELPLLGIDLYFISQVGDNLGRLVDVLQRALSRSDIVITTGGLGPTEDDITREAIAAVLGEKLAVDPGLEQEIREFFAHRSWKMPRSNIRQAMLIPSARPIMNPRGTAPGWWVEKDGKRIIAMPGPPHEMHFMWQEEVAPRLRKLAGGVVILSRTLKTWGLSEAAVDEMLAPFLKETNPSIGVYAKPEGIQFRITAKAVSHDQASGLISLREKEVRAVFGRRIWGEDEETLEGVVGTLLREKKLGLAVMESCTGGLLSSLITDVPGSSAYFKGGIVAYANEVKVASGVAAGLIERHGAVSKEVAVAMAAAVRERMMADIGLSTTGVAGPHEMEGKPVGLVYIALDADGDSRVSEANFAFRRADVKRRASLQALFDLRGFLLDRGQVGPG